MSIKKTKLFLPTISIEVCLKLVALLVVVLMFFKSIIDVDRSYDTWVYHLPFAARIWGIVPAEIYGFEPHEEARFDGFPLLAEFFQGFFWLVLRRVQAANLASYVSLIIYFGFLKVYFRVPLYLSAIALLAIPLVQTHATTCYVDLPGNLALSALILMTYRLYAQPHYQKRDLLTLFIAAASAANIKPQLVPLVFFVLCFTLPRIVWLQYQHSPQPRAFFRWLRFLPIVSLAMLIVFATPIKNIVLLGNPFYPVRIELAGRVLNHQVGLYNASPEALRDAPRPQRWVHSLLEINTPGWSVDQWNGNNPQLMNRMGGFFGAYVVFNVLLLGYLCVRDRSRSTVTAVILVAIMSTVASIFPQSHELRYFMYWMISLVSLNLYLVTALEWSPKLWVVNPRTVGLVCTGMLAVVIASTKSFYIRPYFFTLEKHIQQHANRDILSQIDEGDHVCLVGKQPYTFLYSAYFHPNKAPYSLKASGEAEGCGTRRVIQP
ncbi:MAG: hypothetical protein ACFB4I_05400 [Cyanophyceae cyanobacterium]